MGIGARAPHAITPRPSNIRSRPAFLTSANLTLGRWLDASHVPGVRGHPHSTGPAPVCCSDVSLSPMRAEARMLRLRDRAKRREVRPTCNRAAESDGREHPVLAAATGPQPRPDGQSCAGEPPGFHTPGTSPRDASRCTSSRKVSPQGASSRCTRAWSQAKAQSHVERPERGVSFSTRTSPRLADQARAAPPVTSTPRRLLWTIRQTPSGVKIATSPRPQRLTNPASATRGSGSLTRRRSTTRPVDRLQRTRSA